MSIGKRVQCEKPTPAQLEVQAMMKMNCDRMDFLIPDAVPVVMKRVNHHPQAGQRRVWIAQLRDIWDAEEFGLDIEAETLEWSAQMADQLGVTAEFAAYDPNVEVFVIFATTEGIPLTGSGIEVPALVHPRFIQRW